MKKEKQKTERISPRFGVFDAVIVLLVIVAVVGVYFRYNIMDFISGTRDIKEYSVRYSIEDIRNSTREYIDLDDTVYFASNGEKLGKIIAVEENMGVPLNYQPASKQFVTSSGEFVDIVYPDTNSQDARIDAVGRFVCEGNYSSDGEFLVNGSTYIAPGQYVDIKTDYLTVTICINEIEIYEKN